MSIVAGSRSYVGRRANPWLYVVETAHRQYSLVRQFACTNQETAFRTGGHAPVPSSHGYAVMRKNRGSCIRPSAP